MRILSKAVIIVLFLGFLGNTASAGSLKSIARKMSKEIEGIANKKIAVLDFTYHKGYKSSGSSIVQERLTTYFTETGKVEVVERNLLDKVVEEMRLGITGILDETTTKEIGKILGVGGVVTGTLHDISAEKTEVNARIIDTQTGKILAAARVKIKRTWTDDPVGSDGELLPDEGEMPPDEYSKEPLIQLAIQLDTSGSMDGLLHQAKTQLWKIINELASAEKDGNNPVVRVALYEYGNSRLSSDEKYLKQLLPFTDDLDLVSEKLFSLTTSGGQEYCGAVIMDAVNNLEWDEHSDVYKVIFIAGNEPFTQGPVDFREAVINAKEKQIFVNTIFCGKKQQGIATKWMEGARLADGEYMNIDHEAEIVAIKAPQDNEIQKLGAELNKTFIFYGAKGRNASEKQLSQDVQAGKFKLSGAATERALFKAKSQYSASIAGDLVSDVASGAVDIDEIKKEELPETMRGMDSKEISEYIENKSDERKKIQERINKLNTERRVHIDKKKKELSKKSGKETLDKVILGAVRSQAVKKKFYFK